MNTGWQPRRSAARHRLDDFLPRAGEHYARQRNIDEGWSGNDEGGPDTREHVSGLSPWLARRMLTESEVVAAVIDRHGPSSSRKLVEEVLWRTYFKGWLAHRPSVWDDYQQAQEADAGRVEVYTPRRRALARATEGTTGIECFDHWARELVHTGYLHNHARMWFASIWIFTLRLPWTLGAALFEHELLDGDAASNTLGWRWVAGLHTRGKNYLARASNIAKNTRGRFDPADQLAEHAEPLEEDIEHPKEPLPIIDDPAPGPRSGLLLTTEDLAVERSELAALPLVSAAAGLPPSRVDPRRSERVRRFDDQALDDGLQRLARHADVTPVRLHDGDAWLEDAVRWAKDQQLQRVVAMAPQVGPWESPIERLRTALGEHAIELALGQRRWDRELYPYTDRGFFKLRRVASKGSLLSSLCSAA
ncbi:MAG: FAD-binding domain-containing protein [Nannocystaceae bacterium]